MSKIYNSARSFRYLHGPRARDTSDDGERCIHVSFVSMDIGLAPLHCHWTDILPLASTGSASFILPFRPRSADRVINSSLLARLQPRSACRSRTSMVPSSNPHLSTLNTVIFLTTDRPESGEGYIPCTLLPAPPARCYSMALPLPGTARPRSAMCGHDE